MNKDDFEKIKIIEPQSVIWLKDDYVLIELEHYKVVSKEDNIYTLKFISNISFWSDLAEYGYDKYYLIESDNKWGYGDTIEKAYQQLKDNNK